MHRSVTYRLSLYADDSALIFSHSDPLAIADRLSHELSCCREWLIDNRLSLHVGKTECILFGTSRRLNRVGDFQITCNGDVVSQVTSVKYLGVKLDQHFKFSDHINEVVKKCVGRISFLFRHSSSLDFECRKILCVSLVQPYLDYCCSTWYSSISQRLRSKLEVVQRRMVKFVNSQDVYYHVDLGDFRNLSWLSFPDRVSFFNLMHVFKIRAGRVPSYLLANFRPIAQCHEFNTRQSAYDFMVSKEIAASPRSFVFTAIKQWNSLPRSLKSVGSLRCFKTRLKQHFFSNY